MRPDVRRESTSTRVLRTCDARSQYPRVTVGDVGPDKGNGVAAVRATAGVSREPGARVRHDTGLRDRPDSRARPQQADEVSGGVLADLRRVVRDLLRVRAGDAGGVLLQFDVDGVPCQVVRLDAPAAPAAPAIVPLSPREEEIVRMVARGCTNRMIASVLDISEWTVGTHLRRVFSKLEVNSRAAMVARLFDEGRRPVSM
jgi:DNA-binding NarL/FixJ family response regulator